MCVYTASAGGDQFNLKDEASVGNENLNSSEETQKKPGISISEQTV